MIFVLVEVDCVVVVVVVVVVGGVVVGVVVLVVVVCLVVVGVVVVVVVVSGVVVVGLLVLLPMQIRLAFCFPGVPLVPPLLKKNLYSSLPSSRKKQPLGQLVV